MNSISAGTDRRQGGNLRSLVAVHNSLGWARTEVVSVLCNSINVGVRGPDGQAVTSQVHCDGAGATMDAEFCCNAPSNDVWCAGAATVAV